MFLQGVFEVLQGYKVKVYWVSDHYMKIQLKKLSRTRDNWNFPTQGCGRIRIYTIFWFGTYLVLPKVKSNMYKIYTAFQIIFANVQCHIAEFCVV